jgi:hypothetical protein
VEGGGGAGFVFELVEAAAGRRAKNHSLEKADSSLRSE